MLLHSKWGREWCGAIYNDNSNITIISSIFDNNYAFSNGGAIINGHTVDNIDNLVKMTIIGSQFVNNSGFLRWGGTIANFGFISIFDSLFKENNIITAGGALSMIVLWILQTLL